MLERLMFRKVELWVVGLICIAAFVGMILVSAIAHKMAEGTKQFGLVGDAVLALSMAPEDLMHAGWLLINGQSVELAVSEERFAGQKGFSFSYEPGGNYEAGYLLLSRYDGDRARSVVELVDLDAQKTIHVWEPDIAALNAVAKVQSNLTDISRDNAPARARVLHPLLTPNGEIVFNNMTPLAKVDACGKIIWTLDGIFHHSIEPHPEGGYLVSAFLEPQTIPGVSETFKEDAIVHVSEDGKVMFKKSVAQLLIENGLSHLIYGLDFYSDDPLHLNDIEYARFDSPYWRKGDLFLSLRNVSAIVLYRPSTNKVIWLKQGPWVNQHDVDILDDHRIAAFNNNRFNYQHRSAVNGSNEVVIYDFAKATAVSPYRNHMRALDLRTVSEGRSQILPGGDVFIEESDYGRALRLQTDGSVAWQYVNRAEDGRVYLLNWSRFIPRELGAEIVQRLASTCRKGMSQ